MVKKASPASGNAAPPKSRSRKAATSAAAVEPKAGWGLKPAEPEPGVGLDGSTASGDAGNDGTEAGAAPPTPKTRRKKAEPAPESTPPILSNTQADLIHAVESIERVNEEIESLKDDAKEFFSSLKTKGYKLSIVRELIRRRAMDDDVRSEHDTLLAAYEDAVAAGLGDDE